MFRIICTFMVLIITLGIFCSNHVESRILLGNSDVIPSSQLYYFHPGKGPIDSKNNNEDDSGEYFHVKRKSELLSSLYGLPYALVNKRNAN